MLMKKFLRFRSFALDLAHVKCGILSQTWEGFKFCKLSAEDSPDIWIVIHKLSMISLLRPLSQHVPSNLRHNYLFDYSRCICKKLTAKVFWLSLNTYTLTVALHWKRFLWRKYLLLQISCVCLAWCRYVKFTYRKNCRRL